MGNDMKDYVDLWDRYSMEFCKKPEYTMQGYWYAMRGIQRMGDRSLLALLHGTYMEVFNRFKEDSRLKAYWDITKRLINVEEKLVIDIRHFL